MDGNKAGLRCAKPSGRRRNPGNIVPREDYYTQGYRRNALQANSADLARNLSLCQWMIRRHLDYVSQFTFHSRTGNAELDARIEALMEIDGRPENMDIAGRFGREKMFRIAEMRRVLDGDVLLVKLNDGRLQGVQADLLANPKDTKPDEQWINGVLITQVGRALAYGVNVRDGLTQTKADRRINATDAILYGFFERFAADQVRGISPLVSAYNSLRDVYENVDYALAKAKISQLFALAMMRDATDAPGEYVGEEESADTPESTGAQQTPTKPQIDFGNGPIVLDLDPGEKAEVIESRQPSSEFQQFMVLVIQLCLKALDIPFSFYDESHTNFFGSRAAWLHYERSCKDKRDDQIELRRNYTIFKLRQWIRDGLLTLPRGWTVSSVYFEWQARGMPWWDPTKEIRGYAAAIAAGLDTPQRICKATDTDFFDNIDQIALAQEYAKNKGVSLVYAMDQAITNKGKRNAKQD